MRWYNMTWIWPDYIFTTIQMKIP